MIDENRFADKLEYLFRELIINENKSGIEILKRNIESKYREVHMSIDFMKLYKNSKITSELVFQLEVIKEKFKTIHENFDDKLMIFIVGNGKVGKSSLLNSLVGEQVAKVSFEPCTWKIDVYSPELNDYAIVKTQNGQSEKLSVQKAREKVDLEEKLSREGKKKFNEAKNKVLREIKGKEAREEMREKLSKQFLYTPNISEVRWPVKSKVVDENCLFVDTPGLVQNLYDSNQMGNIQNYYHKSDGIIWMIDATTIAGANVKTTLEELEQEFSTVGGIRSNIICVINRIDIVEENDGEDGVALVLEKAEEIFKGRFNKILPLSAKKAMEGKIEESGLITLRDTIRSIFVEKADLVRSNSKTQGVRLVQKEFIETIHTYLKKLNEKDEERKFKIDNIFEQSKEFKVNNNREIARILDGYLANVNMNINIKIDELANGKGKEFIKNDIYEIDRLDTLVKSFINQKSKEIEEKGQLWLKNAYISEYKYIEDETRVNLISNIEIEVNNLKNLNNIYTFTPDKDSDLLSTLWNFGGRIKFFLKKNKIKNDLNMIIKVRTNTIVYEIDNALNNCIDKYMSKCREQMDNSFEALFGNKNNKEYIERNLQQHIINIEKDIKDKEIYELLI